MTHVRLRDNFKHLFFQRQKTYGQQTWQGVNLREEGQDAKVEVPKFLFFIQPYWNKVVNFFYRGESVMHCLQNNKNRLV